MKSGPADRRAFVYHGRIMVSRKSRQEISNRKYRNRKYRNRVNRSNRADRVTLASRQKTRTPVSAGCARLWCIARWRNSKICSLGATKCGLTGSVQCLRVSSAMEAGGMEHDEIRLGAHSEA